MTLNSILSLLPFVALAIFIIRIADIFVPHLTQIVLKVLEGLVYLTDTVLDLIGFLLLLTIIALFARSVLG